MRAAATSKPVCRRGLGSLAIGQGISGCLLWCEQDRVSTTFQIKTLQSDINKPGPGRVGHPGICVRSCAAHIGPMVPHLSVEITSSGGTFCRYRAGARCLASLRRANIRCGIPRRGDRSRPAARAARFGYAIPKAVPVGVIAIKASAPSHTSEGPARGPETAPMPPNLN